MRVTFTEALELMTGTGRGRMENLLVVWVVVVVVNPALLLCLLNFPCRKRQEVMMMHVTAQDIEKGVTSIGGHRRRHC